MGAGNGGMVDADFEHARPFTTITSMSFQLGRSLGSGSGCWVCVWVIQCYICCWVLFVLTTLTTTKESL